MFINNRAFSFTIKWSKIYVHMDEDQWDSKILSL